MSEYLNTKVLTMCLTFLYYIYFFKKFVFWKINCNFIGKEMSSLTLKADPIYSFHPIKTYERLVYLMY